MLATTAKRLASLPVFGSRRAKYFWCVRMEVWRISGGTSMNAESISPISTTGHSARPITSLARPSSSISSRPSAKAFCFASCRMVSRRSAPSRITCARAQLRLVVVEAAHLDCTLRKKAVAARGVAAFHAGDLERHDLAVEGRDDGMQRAHPAEAAVAPAHGFGPGQFLDRFGKKFGEHVGGGAALAVDHRDVEVALGIGALLALVERDAGRFQKAFDRLFGRVDARAFLLFGDVGLLGGQAGDRERQAARAGKAADAFEHQAAVGERADDEALQVLRGLRLHARGDFFGEELEEKVRHSSRRALQRAHPPSARMRAASQRCGPSPSRGEVEIGDRDSCKCASTPASACRRLGGLRARLRSRLWRARARGRCRRRVRSR